MEQKESQVRFTLEQLAKASEYKAPLICVSVQYPDGDLYDLSNNTAIPPHSKRVEIAGTVPASIAAELLEWITVNANIFHGFTQEIIGGERHKGIKRITVPAMATCDGLLARLENNTDDFAAKESAIELLSLDPVLSLRGLQLMFQLISEGYLIIKLEEDKKCENEMQ
jgi:hypothetical protein